MCDTCSFPVVQNGHCDGDDDDDDGGDGDTLSVRKATGDTDVCHLYFLEDDDDEYDDYYDGDDEDTLSVREATGDTDVCHLYAPESHTSDTYTRYE